MRIKSSKVWFGPPLNKEGAQIESHKLLSFGALCCTCFSMIRNQLGCKWIPFFAGMTFIIKAKDS